jgi:Transposase DNA-binding/Transposase Tn5 dimerisation domain
MNDVTHSTEPRMWAEEHFGDLPFSDVRRSERAITIATAMASNPGASIPQLFAHPYDTKAAYTFFAHPEVEPETLQLTHRSLVAERMERPGTYLLIEDTTELDWTGRERIPGLGPIGNSTVSTQGVLLHTVLGVQWPEDKRTTPHGHRPAVTVLGVCDQQYHIRVPRRAGERRGDSWPKKKRARESQIWQRASERMGAAPEQARWVRIGDAAADIYEHLTICRALGYGFVIRSGQDRALVSSEAPAPGKRLYETARAAACLGRFTVELPARKGAPARVATLAVSAKPVQLRSPQRPGVSIGQLPPVPCTVVRVWEEHPATSGEALEWILLCDAPVQSFVQAHTCALQYATRWVIEEYHKALKTGLGAERLQFETAARLFAAVAIMSVVALRLVGLREQVRCTPDRPAETAGLVPLELEVLRSVNAQPVRTVREVALAIGRLGGHLNRRQDGLPGWQTLWLGMKKLALLVEGVRLARQMNKFGE